MATSGERNRAFASSKFSRSTRETYSGSNAISTSGGRALSGPPHSGLSSQPRVELAPLRVGRGGIELPPPALGRVPAQRHPDTHQLLPPRGEEGDPGAALVLLHPLVQPIRAHAADVERHNLV